MSDFRPDLLAEPDCCRMHRALFHGLHDHTGPVCPACDYRAAEFVAEANCAGPIMGHATLCNCGDCRLRDAKRIAVKCEQEDHEKQDGAPLCGACIKARGQRLGYVAEDNVNAPHHFNGWTDEDFSRRMSKIPHAEEDDRF